MQRHENSIASGENFCPLIIYSPAIEGNVQVTNLCYQMDVYPTVKHLIGCANDGWNGLGVNLLDPTARRNRPIDEQEAYRLSDLMIRSDYFRRYLPMFGAFGTNASMGNGVFIKRGK